MEGSNSASPASTGRGTRPTMGWPASTQADPRPDQWPPSGGMDGHLDHPELPIRASRDASRLGMLAARVLLCDATLVQPAAQAGSQPPAAIDVEQLNDRMAEGRLPRAALQLALDRPGQTIELELVLLHPSCSRPAADTPPDRTLRLRCQPGRGIAVSTSAPSAGDMLFGSRDPAVLEAKADTVADLLGRVSSLDQFMVARARVDPRPVPTGLPGPSPASRLTGEEQSLIGVARWPDRAYNKEHDPQQQAYGRSFWKASRDAGAQIAQGQIRSLRELWTYAQDWRGRMAPGGDGKRFGLGSRRRAEGEMSRCTTPLNGAYAYVRDRYRGRADGILEEPECTSRRYTLHGLVGDERIALSSVVIRSYGDDACSRQPFTGWNGARSEAPPFRLEHTSVQDAQRILGRAEGLLVRVLVPSTPQVKALALLGELHWWLAQAMPDTRGSAAKAELCVRALAQARGMDLPPFAHGVVPDVEAMTREREDFVGGYARMFSRSPLVP
jgi:avirulence protein